jgi:Zn-dependent metalloprotease
MVMAIALSGVQTGHASPIIQKGPDSNVVYDPNTGALAFIGTNPGQEIHSLLANPGAASFAQNATAFASTYAAQMGLSNVSANLALAKVNRGTNGRSMIRFHQVYQGLPVFASDVIINTNAQGAMTSLTAKTSPALQVDANPSVTSETASTEAIAATAKYENVNAADLTASTPQLQVYDARLVLNDGRPARLVWKVEVSAQAAPIREMVLVDAHSGLVSLHYNQIDTALGAPGGSPHRSIVNSEISNTTLHTPGTAVFSVYTMQHKCDPADFVCLLFYGSAGYQSLPGTFLCSNSNTVPCNIDADASHAYTFSADTYNFYYNQFGRDSYDGSGTSLSSVVHYGLNYPNAFWDGTEMVYGDGFSSGDDVVAHELTHAVTAHASELIYFGQPGAINESMSDVFGELIDQTNGHGTDTAAKKWLLGEDLPASIGVIRNMANPPAYGDPDKMTSSLYYLGAADNAGVHTNSGLNNKAAFLMTDGGSFNGKVVTGLGIPKVAAIYYEVQTNLLGSGASYFDLYYALSQACTNLLGTTPSGAGSAISSSDCTQVKNAVDAVQMNLTKSATVYPLAPYCPAGQEPDAVSGNLFFDDFESGDEKWTFGHDTALAGDEDWFIGSGDSAAGTNSLVGGYATELNNSYAAMVDPVAIPSTGDFYLHFEHDDIFDSSWNYDGGVVEYSKDSGAWTDAAALFNAGKNYNGTIANITLFGPNPLAGRKAFTYSTMSYTSTRYALAAFNGHNIRFRFRVGNDNSVSSTWYVDNVRIYRCVAIPAVPVLLTVASGALLTNLTPTLDWQNAAPDADHYRIQIDNDPLFGSAEIDEASLTNSIYTVPSGLINNKTYYWRVRAFNINGVSKGWTAARYFRTPLPTPELNGPGNTAPALLQTNRPALDWSDVPGATSYTLQVAKNYTFTTLLLTSTATRSDYVPALDLPRATLLYWRVRANGANMSPYSAPFSFTTGNSPSTPILASPLTNMLSTTYTPLLKWKPVTLGTTRVFDHFEVQVDDQDDFSSPITLDNLPTGGNTSPGILVGPALDPNTKYYWHVRAFDNASDYSGWSTVWTLRTAIAAPVLLSPASGGSSGGLKPSFDWNDVAGASGYVVQVSTSPAFSTLIVSKVITGPISIYMPATNLPAGATIYWRVKATGPNGPGVYSSTASLVTSILTLTPANILAPTPTATQTPTNTPTTTATPTVTETPAPTGTPSETPTPTP